MQQTLCRDWFAQRVWEDDGGPRYSASEARHPHVALRHDRFAAKGVEVHHRDRFAIVITHAGARNRLIDMPWLEKDYRIDESDWIVLSPDGWRAVAEGDAVIWDALQRKLRVGFYVNQPHLIAVAGHPSGRVAADSCVNGRQEIRRIVRRVRSLLLPTTVLGFWTDEQGVLRDVLDPNGGRPVQRVEMETVQ